jgi:hypothetical protein
LIENPKAMSANIVLINFMLLISSLIFKIVKQ